MMFFPLGFCACCPTSSKKIPTRLGKLLVLALPQISTRFDHTK